MERCYKCGASKTAAMLFCINCGAKHTNYQDIEGTTKLQQPEQAPASQIESLRRCLTCDTEQAELVFCDACGYRVDDPCENQALRAKYLSVGQPQIIVIDNTPPEPEGYIVSFARASNLIGSYISFVGTLNSSKTQNIPNGHSETLIVQEEFAQINISPSSTLFRFGLLKPNIRMRLRFTEKHVEIKFWPNMLGMLECSVRGAQILEKENYQ